MDDHTALPIDLLDQARAYAREGDIYQAVKVYRLILRQCPAWSAPARELGQLYADRREWKPALHYLKKALALEPHERNLWWAVGTAATALQKERLARSIWAKFGWTHPFPRRGESVVVRLQQGAYYEILWAHRLGPVTAVLASIPSPDSGLAHRDEVLLDGTASGYHVLGRRRFPVFDVLDVQKRSHFHTWSCALSHAEAQAVEVLAELCAQQGIGFENWSNASRSWQGSYRNPEYYHHPMPAAAWEDDIVVAFAFPHLQPVEDILQSWTVITGGSYGTLEARPDPE
jgi:tetratricopeptide (TPR) repeat protein